MPLSLMKALVWAYIYEERLNLDHLDVVYGKTRASGATSGSKCFKDLLFWAFFIACDKELSHMKSDSAGSPTCS